MSSRIDREKKFASIDDIDFIVVAQKLELTLWYFKRKNQHRRSLQYLKSERLLYKSHNKQHARWTQSSHGKKYQTNIFNRYDKAKYD